MTKLIAVISLALWLAWPSPATAQCQRTITVLGQRVEAGPGGRPVKKLATRRVEVPCNFFHSIQPGWYIKDNWFSPGPNNVLVVEKN